MRPLRSIRHPSAVLALAALLTVASAAAADRESTEEDPLVGDRPDFTESALTINPGRFQIETGITVLDESAEDVQEIGELLVRVGLTKRAELRLTLGSYVRIEGPGGADTTGFSDSGIGAKIGIAETGGWTTAVLLGTTLPTGSRESRGSSLQPSAVFAAERDLSRSAALGVNVGYFYASAEGERFGEVLASAAVGVGLGETTGAFFELFGIIPESSGGLETYFFDTGLTKALSADLQLDVRAGAGLNSSAADFFAGAGLVWRY